MTKASPATHVVADITHNGDDTESDITHNEDTDEAEDAAGEQTGFMLPNQPVTC